MFLFSYLWRFLRGLVFWYFLVVLVLSLAWKIIPPVSTVMLGSLFTGDGMTRHWVPLKAVSPNVIRAVLVAEDSAFCTHHGIDWRAMNKVIERGGRRGASTITMQVTKNLFLWNGRSWLRKAIEAPLALWIDLTWSKRRILEVYLNIAQWGDGVFGIEAASRRAFGVHASQVSPAQAALLATTLPDPERRRAGRPGPAQLSMSGYLQGRLAREGALTECIWGQRPRRG